MLIAYGDHVRRASENPLATLHSLLKQLALPIKSVHILPFYPYTSDDGFSVIDYKAVDPALGDWEDVRRLSADYRLMFDAVFNHISAHSAWFQAFLRGEAPYTDYFISLPAVLTALVLGIEWRTARHHISSHDGQYGRKKRRQQMIELAEGKPEEVLRL